MVGILSSAAVVAAISELVGKELWEGNPLTIRGGALDQKMTELGIPDGIPQAAAVVVGATMLRRYLNSNKLNPGVKIGRKQYLRLV